MTYSSKYWFQELREWLIAEGFVQSKVHPCFFCKEYEDKSVVKLLDYVDDRLYFSTSNASIKTFKEHLSECFDVEVLGQEHWYLLTCITQEQIFNITVDQSRYYQ